jgi:glycosyltransferase involved in cell wall biosynthesis
VVIVPLISGGGTKFKIVQSIACGKLVITTSIGAEGLEDVASELMWVADDWQEFTALVVRALQEQPQVDLNGPAFTRFVKEYSWGQMTARFVEVLESLRA